MFAVKQFLDSTMRKLKTEIVVQPPMAGEAQSVWYAGMVAEPLTDPIQFSQQLVNLQLSLQRANTPVVRSAAVAAAVVHQ